MDGSSRQEELDGFLHEALLDNDKLKRALEVFQIGQNQYVRALASMQSVAITSDDNTSLGSEKDADVDSNQERDRKPK